VYVKRFRGATVAEALSLAKRELGEDALLLGTSRPEGAPSNASVEVTVAAERPRPSTTPPRPYAPPPAKTTTTRPAAASTAASLAPPARRQAVATPGGATPIQTAPAARESESAAGKQTSGSAAASQRAGRGSTGAGTQGLSGARRGNSLPVGSGSTTASTRSRLVAQESAATRGGFSGVGIEEEAASAGAKRAAAPAAAPETDRAASGRREIGSAGSAGTPDGADGAGLTGSSGRGAPSTRGEVATISAVLLADQRRDGAGAGNGPSFEERATEIQAGFDLLSKRVERIAREMRPGQGGASGRREGGTLEFEEIVSRLESTGLERDLCEGAARAALARFSTSRGRGGESLTRLLAESLAGVIAVEAPDRAAEKRILAFVGPPGGGKTTTAVKLAAIEAHAKGKRAVLVCADAWRIGAVEQLAEYADLIGVPLETARTADDLGAILERRADADLILIDTAGGPPGDNRRMYELKSLLDGAPGFTPLLVLSATTRRRDLAEAVRRFHALGAPGLVFTKMDETSAYGELLSEAASSGCGVSGFTTGQSVPDDYEPATPLRFAEYVVRAAWSRTKES
jgi:flagellar biosynthesis GTPase FlhF